MMSIQFVDTLILAIDVQTKIVVLKMKRETNEL